MGTNSAEYLSQRRKKAIDAGMCPQHTSIPVIAGTKSCEKCVVRNKKRKEKLQNAGKCLSHVKVSAVKGHDYCQECLDNYSKRSEKRRIENIKSGYCPNHPNELAKEGTLSCIKCSDYARERITIHKLNGFCPSHPSILAAEGSTYCTRCIEKDKKKATKNKQKALEHNLCHKCSTQPKVINSTCEECWFKYLAWKHLGSSDLALELKEMFYIKQKQRCIYSDIMLIPGSEDLDIRASVDHIISTKKGGPKSIDNVQWVSSKLNVMKQCMSHNNFVKLAGTVASRFGNAGPLDISVDDFSHAAINVVYRPSLCRKCHKNPSEINTTCKKCWFRIKALTHLGNVGAAHALEDLFYTQQKELCVYSGVRLIPGSSDFAFCASLDHIVPGLKTLDNVQWISYALNTMKSDFSHDAFVSLCERIFTKFGASLQGGNSC